MFEQIFRWLKRLWQRWFSQKTPSPPPTRQPEARSEVEYESIFMELLRGIAEEGWHKGDAKWFVTSKKVENKALAAWLRQFAENLPEESPKEILRDRLELLARLDIGEVSQVAWDVVAGWEAEEAKGEGEENDQLPTEQTLSNIEESPEFQILLKVFSSQYQASNLQQALVTLEQIIALDPENYLALGAKGELLKKLGRLEEAIASYDHALKFKPNYHRAWFNRGIILCDHLKKHEEALASFDQALQIQPDEHHTWHNRGEALRNLGRLEEEIESYDQALNFKPNYHQAWKKRGIALDKLGRLEEEIASYDRALQIQPDDHEVWYNRGIALDELGRLEEAIASYDRALQFQPDYNNAWYNRGIALINLGSLEEAISSYNRALQFQPDYHLAWLGRGIALINLGSLEEAIASYDHALQIQPDYHLAWANRSIAAASSPSPDLEYQHNFLYHFQRRLAQFSHYTLSIWENAPVGTLHATSLQNETAQQIKEAAREHFSLKYPQLNNRGYNGRITSLKFPLKQGIIHPNTLPWGFLYHQLGKAQYNQANNPKPSYPPLGENPSRGQLFHQAKTSHETALETLTFDQYPELHLEVLQDLIPVCVDIKLDQEASQHLKKGIILLERHLENKPPREQERLSRKFSPFYQLKVEEFIRNGDLIQAIETAEERKNYCLQWFPQTPEKLEFSQIQQHLCTPTTAILYWHLSPVSLSTFLILAQGDPILIEQPPNPQPWGLPDSASDNTPLSQTWERGWGRGQHQNLINRLSHWKTKDSDKDKTPTNWKDNLSDNLQTLAQILNIPSIRQELQNHGIQTLILIPHRDLHLLPLHAFFDCPAFYLPSAYLGCQNNTFNPPLTPLNLIENPKSTPTLNNQKKHLAALPFAEIEATLLRHQFPQHRHLTQTDITQTNTETLLKTPARVFHFCGHAAYNSQDPKKSCLFLHETEVLTVETIRQLDLKHYDLVSLAACETAVTGSDLILDEYVGLVSAFLSSGVTYVLSTLWQVESFATSLFILEFYRHLAQNPPHLALQLTRDWLKNATPDRLCESCDRHLQNLTKFEHRKPLTTRREQIAQLESTATPYQNPYYWAAFILAGYHKSDKI